MTVTLFSTGVSADHEDCCVCFFRRLKDKCLRHIIFIKRSLVFPKYFVHDSAVYHFADLRPVKLILFRYLFCTCFILIKFFQQRFRFYPSLFTFFQNCAAPGYISTTGSISGIQSAYLCPSEKCNLFLLF